MKEKETKTNQQPKESQKEKLQKLTADLEHWKNEYYRAYADMQNLRKSVEKDHHEAIKYRAEGFISNLLPILDGFHMALQNEPTTKEMENFLVGFEYIYRNLVSVLENEGVKEYAPKIGDDFDASFMQALETKYDEGKPNKILKIMTNGYKLHDHLIRPAMVVVSTDKKEDTKENKNNTEDVDA